MARFILSNNAGKLAEALAGVTSATVEAEYGDNCVPGSVATLAHHGSRRHNPCPCLFPNSTVLEVEVIGGSHYDLDYLGGALAVAGLKPEGDSFWQLAAFVDINGPHKLAQSGASPEDVRRLYAFWAWSQANGVMTPRDGAVLDVTDKVMEGLVILQRVLADDVELLVSGDTYREAETQLNESSFRELRHGVVVRVANSPVNHLYVTPTGKVGKMCVVMYTNTGGITVSLADPFPGVSACDIVRSLWGPKAGGHAGIAGSPRDQQMTEVDLQQAVTRSVTALIGVL